MVSAEAKPAVAAAPPLVDAELMLLEGPAAREANLLEMQVRSCVEDTNSPSYNTQLSSSKRGHSGSIVTQ